MRRKNRREEKVRETSFFGGKKFLNKFWTRCDFLYSQDWFGLHQPSFLSFSFTLEQARGSLSGLGQMWGSSELKREKEAKVGFTSGARWRIPHSEAVRQQLNPEPFFPLPQKATLLHLFSSLSLFPSLYFLQKWWSSFLFNRALVEKNKS